MTGIFTKEEVAKLRFDSSRPPYVMRNDPLWKKAFAIYNQNLKKKLSMNCSSCYFKVLSYIKSVSI